MEREGYSDFPDGDVDHSWFRAVHDKRQGPVWVFTGLRNNRRTGKLVIGIFIYLPVLSMLGIIRETMRRKRK